MPSSSPTLDECRYNPDRPYTSLNCTNQKIEQLEQEVNQIVDQPTTQHQPIRTYPVPGQVQPSGNVPISNIDPATSIGIGALATVLLVALLKGFGERIGNRLGSLGDKKK